jgi:hypothetical protein
MSANIDQIVPTESLIDLSQYTSGEFAIPDHLLTVLFDDLILAKFTDVSEDGNAIKRGDIYIPLNTAPKAWRTGEVLMVGDKCNNVSIGDTVIFPGNNGIPVKNLQYSQDGIDSIVQNGIFLKEERLFGVCKHLSNESSITDTEDTS